jgi:hypothetical protein
MNLTSYEQTGQTLYGEFATIVSFILEQTIAATGASASINSAPSKISSKPET